jgi:hypothetical protein
MEFNLKTEIEQLRREPAWQNGRNAKTMVEYPDFRVVLTVIKGNTRIHEHHSDGRISVQTGEAPFRTRETARKGTYA